VGAQDILSKANAFTHTDFWSYRLTDKSLDYIEMYVLFNLVETTICKYGLWVTIEFQIWLCVCMYWCFLELNGETKFLLFECISTVSLEECISLHGGQKFGTDFWQPF
jgi:hypothetical protein